MNTAKRAAILIASAGAVVGASAGAAVADGASAVAAGSPGFISGNVIQAPIDIPINLCGNTIGALGDLANPAFRNTCINSDR
ncbi:chaplin [Streptomyces sp. NPDC048639]|uniref:chaplin n=1 Tax=Streptomyces sp. NPDC048639 TaxID=3365581 RepID=UPI003720917E